MFVTALTSAPHSKAGNAVVALVWKEDFDDAPIAPTIRLVVSKVDEARAQDDTYGLPFDEEDEMPLRQLQFRPFLVPKDRSLASRRLRENLVEHPAEQLRLFV